MVAEATSGSLELSRALVDEGCQALLGVLALEKLLLQLALQSEAVLEGDLGSRLDGALDPAYRPGCLLRRAELAGIGVHLFEIALGVENQVDESHLLRVLEGEEAARPHQPHCPTLS